MREDKLFTVYIVTNTTRGVFYVGVTSDLLGSGPINWIPSGSLI